MYKNSYKKVCIFSFLLFISSVFVFADGTISTQAHEDSVTQIASLETSEVTESSVISCSKDGFLIKWDENDLGEHYQITDLQIKLVTRNPNTKEIAVYETDGVSIHRVSVWNWETLTRKYAKRFPDSVTGLSYSEKGTYLLVGTAAMNGVYVLNASTGNVAKKPANAPSLCTLLKTGDSEKNLIMYSQTGSLVYYTLSTNKQKAKFYMEPRLEQVYLFGSGDTKNRFIAGYKDNSVYIVDALSGKNIAVYSSNQALVFSSRSEFEDGIYFTSTNGKEYTLKKVTNETLKKQVTASSDSVYNPPAPLLLKKFTGPKGKDYFTSASKNISLIYFGSATGNIYKLNALPESEKLTLFPITDKKYEKIYDICSDNENIYCLTERSIYKTSYETNAAVNIGSNSFNTEMIKYEDGAILWAKNKNSNIQYVNFNGKGGTPSVLFTPDSIVTSLKLFNNKLIYIEGNSSVYVFDISTGERKEIYTGSALQDAILYNDTFAYIAKTSAIEPLTALVQVNLETGETLPIKFTGTIAYSLCYDSSKPDGPFYGITITAENSKTYTKVFSFQPKNNSTLSLLKIQDEDSEANTLLRDSYLFTNIGKTAIRSYNINRRKSITLKRSASLPVKADITHEMTAVLNKDGSITWYESNSTNPLADWYLTMDGNWISF